MLCYIRAKNILLLYKFLEIETNFITISYPEYKQKLCYINFHSMNINPNNPQSNISIF